MLWQPASGQHQIHHTPTSVALSLHTGYSIILPLFALGSRQFSNTSHILTHPGFGLTQRCRTRRRSSMLVVPWHKSTAVNPVLHVGSTTCTTLFTPSHSGHHLIQQPNPGMDYRLTDWQDIDKSVNECSIFLFFHLSLLFKGFFVFLNCFTCFWIWNCMDWIAGCFFFVLFF